VIDTIILKILKITLFGIFNVIMIGLSIVSNVSNQIMAAFSNIFGDNIVEEDNNGQRSYVKNHTNDDDIEKYVKKVVQTLFFQFLFTFSCVMIIAISTHARFFCILNALQILGFGFIGGLTTLLCMYMSSVKTDLQLGIFTIFETMVVCVGSCVYTADVVLISAIVTMCITFGLGIYALTTNQNHMHLEPFLFCGLSFLLIVMVWNMFLGNGPLFFFSTFFGILLFFGYVIFDIQYFLKEQIINAKKKSQSIPEDLHIDAALNIYLDVINIFIRVLKIVNAIIGEKK
jgi:FtsH-binding integral membrane protein